MELDSSVHAHAGFFRRLVDGGAPRDGVGWARSPPPRDNAGASRPLVIVWGLASLRGADARRQGAGADARWVSREALDEHVVFPLAKKWAGRVAFLTAEARREIDLAQRLRVRWQDVPEVVIRDAARGEIVYRARDQHPRFGGRGGSEGGEPGLSRSDVDRFIQGFFDGRLAAAPMETETLHGSSSGR
jgi:hypothetical protein